MAGDLVRCGAVRRELSCGRRYGTSACGCTTSRCRPTSRGLAVADRDIEQVADASQPEPDPGIRVTVEDLKTGELQTAVIRNDYVLITAGTCHVSSIQDWPRSGTRQLTIKGRGGRG